MTTTYEVEKIFKYFNKNKVYTAEAELLADTRRFLETIPGVTVVRIEAGSERGKSDIVMCINGIFVAAELKDDIGEPSAQQLKFINTIRKSGGIAGICRTLEDMHDLLVEAINRG